MSNINLRLVRVKQGKSQYVLSSETGISQSTLSLIENCFRQPNREEIKKISKALDTKVNELFPEFRDDGAKEDLMTENK